MTSVIQNFEAKLTYPDRDLKKKITSRPDIKSAGDPTNQGGEDGVLGPI